jgi:hypothetical protein
MHVHRESGGGREVFVAHSLLTSKRAACSTVPARACMHACVMLLGPQDKAAVLSRLDPSKASEVLALMPANDVSAVLRPVGAP